MRYRMVVDLPCEINVGDGHYVLDLVQGDKQGVCWLRVHEREEPVVFLLARFRDQETALFSLAAGIEVADQPFVRQLMRELVDEGLAEPVTRTIRRRETAPEPAWVTLAPATSLELAGV